jgi:hypothetical protein
MTSRFHWGAWLVRLQATSLVFATASGCSFTREVWMRPKVVETRPPVVESVGTRLRVHWSGPTTTLTDASNLYLRLTIRDSVISAPICVRSPGNVGLSLLNNTLDCDLGVELTSGPRQRVHRQPHPRRDAEHVGVA